VDPNRLIYTLPLPAQKDLIDELMKFCQRRTNKGGRWTRSSCYPLKQWQRLAGWLNWSLDVFLLLRPGLCNLYQKIRHKTEPNDLIFVNNAVCEDLSWMAEHMSRSSGIHIVWSLTWEIRDADIVIFCDACLSGMGFWYPNLNSAFFPAAPLDWLPLGTPRTKWILPFESSVSCLPSGMPHSMPLLKRTMTGCKRMYGSPSANPGHAT